MRTVKVCFKVEARKIARLRRDKKTRGISITSRIDRALDLLFMDDERRRRDAKRRKVPETDGINFKGTPAG